MDKEALRAAYEKAIEAKLITHTTAAAGTGINVESLKKFKTLGSLKDDKREKLREWLDRRELLPVENTGDVLREVRRKLLGCLDTLDNPMHGRDRKARIVLNEIEVIHREYGPELFEMGKVPTE